MEPWGPKGMDLKWHSGSKLLSEIAQRHELNHSSIAPKALVGIFVNCDSVP
jgi:hypothetical protein